MNILRHVLAGLGAVLLCGGAVAGENPVNVNIRSASMSDALNEFAAQTGLQLLLHVERVMPSDLKAPAVVGALTPSAALDKLLANSGLHYTFINERTVEIRAADPNKKISARDDRLRLSQVASPEPPAIAGRGGEAGDGSADVPAQARGVPEILVEGSRALNTDIRRTEDDPQPYVIFGGQEILDSQALNLEEFLRTRLPMNTASDRKGQGVNDAGTFSLINLRGLGVDETLILVDGRRMPRVAAAGTMLQPDINGVPLAAIERVEVLPSTAGGIYGGSANGGVINIVMKRDYQGMEAGVTYANTFDTDAGTRRVDLSAGFSLEGGRTQVTLAGSYSDGNFLLVGDRDFSRISRARLLHNNPGATDFGPPLGATPNILSAYGDPLVLDQEYGGTELNSTFTHVPRGYRGAAADGAAALVANANSYDTGFPDDANGLRGGLVAVPSMRSLSVNLRREFGSRVEAFLDLASLGNEGTTPAASLPNTVFELGPDAPNNPFQQAIMVTYPVPNLSFDARSKSDTVRAGGGVIVRLGHDWVSEMDAGWSRARLAYEGASNWIDPDGGTALNTGESPGPGLPALDILQDGNAAPLNFGPYLLPLPDDRQGPQDTVLKNASLRFSGPSLHLPGGPLTLSALVERREEHSAASFNRSIDDFDQLTGADETLTYYPKRVQNVDSAHVEARAPLIERRLELQLSVRHDRYETIGDPSIAYPPLAPGDPLPVINYFTNRVHSTDYTMGLRFAPIADVAVRASFGTGFLPPSTVQVGSRRSFLTRPNSFTDPARGFTDVYVGLPIERLTGGSPDVKPEESESWSAGVVFTPTRLPGLRLSLDYTKIEKADEIRAVGTDFILAYEAAYPDRVRRDPARRRPTDPAGWADPISFINATLINISSTELQAYDLQADYDLETSRMGTFRFSVLATWQPDYISRLLPDTGSFNSVGYFDGPLEWRANAGVQWTRGPLSAAWNVQYYDSYHITYGDPDFQIFDDETVLNQGSDTIARQQYHDAVFAYRFGAASRFAGGLFGNSELSVGVQNVFNRTPPIIAELNPFNPISAYGDPRLRRYSVSFRKRFH